MDLTQIEEGKMKVKEKWGWYDWSMLALIILECLVLVGALVIAFLGITYIGSEGIRYLK